MNKRPDSSDQRPESHRPWPLSWVLIVILVYIALQTAYFIFFAK